MIAKVCKESKLAQFFNKLLEEYDIIAPKKKKNLYEFSEVNDFREVALDYSTTILPPKKYLIPQKENLLRFVKGEITSEEPQLKKKQVIFGIHACDLNAFLLLDKVFMDKFPCPRYVKRRENLITIALTCINPSDTCFCESIGTGPTPSKGYDLLLTKINENYYLIESGSETGEKLIKLVEGKEASSKELEEKNKVIELTKQKFKRRIYVDNLPELIQKNLNHELWRLLGEVDLACGQCVLSCPTCYCFDVKDELNLSLDSGIRYKEWDACFLLEFAEVALGGNFRKDRSARVRQFMGHNLGWGGALQYDVFNGELKCVGCGRCIKTCPVGIDITEVAAVIKGEKSVSEVTAIKNILTNVGEKNARSI
ncbi:MAG: 4Fe-4S dicluster domain-containing protein [Candidatus Bathyarchaeia archaeon]|nr:4Fe-4S dicluster domain-containing protein [Candidatus Bathyarchaeota archaeon]